MNCSNFGDPNLPCNHTIFSLASNKLGSTIIPISGYHFLQIKNNMKIQAKNDEDQEDIL